MNTGKNNIANELLQVAPLLAAGNKEMPFVIPEGYFDEFIPTMLQLVKASALSDVPEGYFDQFALKMLQKVRKNEVWEELEVVSPFLNSLPKTMPHTIPPGYFEQWQPSILNKETQQPAKVIRLGGLTNWKKWAAAAAIVFTMGISWQLWVKNDTQSSVTAAASPAIVDTLLTGIDASSLNDYLENSQANSEFASLLMVAEQDVETGVGQLSDEELMWYLDNQAVEMPGT